MIRNRHLVIRKRHCQARVLTQIDGLPPATTKTKPYLTPSAAPPPQKRAKFSTPATPGGGSARANPSPVIVQRRGRAARHSRTLHALARVSVLLVADLLVLILANDVLHFLRSEQGPPDQFARFLLEISPRGVFPRLQVVAAVITGLVIFRNYGTGPARRHSRRLIAGSTLGLSLVFWAHIWKGISIASAFGFVLALATLGLSLIAGRRLVDRLVQRLRPAPTATGRALVVAPRTPATAFMQADRVRQDSRLDVIGFVSTDSDTDDQSLGKLSDLVWLLERHDIDTIIIADQLGDEMLVDLLEVAHRMGCVTLSAAPRYPVGGFIPQVVQRGHIPYVEIRRPRLDDAQLLVKRAFDTVVAALLLVALSPVFAAVAIAVRASSPGPVFFRQKRVGHGGHLFDMYKFRSMVQDAELTKEQLAGLNIYADERLFKIKNDPRVTPLGRFLRSSSLDELPQLWNVLRGSMSLVGPRPPLASEVARYEEHHYSRFDMRPGITGLWQTSGRSDVTSFDAIIALDAEYLNNWSLTKDFVILLKTIPVVLSMRGAV